MDDMAMQYSKEADDRDWFGRAPRGLLSRAIAGGWIAGGCLGAIAGLASGLSPLRATATVTTVPPETLEAIDRQEFGQPAVVGVGFSEATIAPSAAKLGDTLTVRVKAAAASQPTVRYGNETFEMFPLKTDPISGLTLYRALVPTSPLTRAGTQTLTIQADSQSQQFNVPLASRQFPHQSIRFSGSGGLEATDKELDAVAAFKQSLTTQKLWNGAFLRPTGGYVSAVYGVRRSYNGEFAQDYYHRGVDYAIDTGTPVVAPAGGKVVLVGRHNDGFVVHGNTVGLDHGQGVTSIFIHLSSIDVAVGQTVAAGTRLGRVGTTGASTGPHLHWGLFVHGVAVDPVPWRYGGIE